MSERSIVEYFSAQEGYMCGYCKSENSCYSQGMWAHSLNALDYQNLIDRGWRRSGKYCYKPTMHLTCCPHYTIRCEANKLNLSRSQKKVLKRLHRFLQYGEQNKNSNQQGIEDTEEQTMEVCDLPTAVDVQSLKNFKKVEHVKSNEIENISFEMPLEKEVKSVPPTDDSISNNCITKDARAHCKKNVIDPSKPLCRKAKVMRQEKKFQKLLKMGLSPELAEASAKKKSIAPKKLEDFISEPFSSAPMHKLELRLVPSSLENPLFFQTFEETYNVYKKYQMKIHKDSEEKCSKKQFIRFLVKSPFQEIASPPVPSYGSFHQQYWLNDKLMAVGVIDILPYCVSSVYFYYDPDFSHLSLGTYAALREIALTRELNSSYPDLQYYYMGYYIHSCVKMRYKGQYNPSYLLCPETYIFKPIEQCKPKLDIAKYQRLEEDPNAEDGDGVVNLTKVLILFDKKLMTYPVYSRLNKNANDEEIVRQYAKFVGKKCYGRMLLFRS